MTSEVLLVGCPESYKELLPDRVRAVIVDDSEEDDAFDPLVIVVGSRVRKPLFTAQRLARSHTRSGMVVATRSEDFSQISDLLRVTPFIPLGTSVARENSDELRDAIQRALVRSELRQSQSRILESAARALERSRTKHAAGSAGEVETEDSALYPKADDEHLAAFVRLFHEHRESVSESLAANVAGELSLGSLLDALSEKLIGKPEPGMDRGELEKEEWGPVLERVRDEGRAFAEDGITLLAWRQRVAPIRQLLQALVLEHAGSGKEASQAREAVRFVLTGLDRFFDMAESAMSEGYLEEQTRHRIDFERRKHLFASVLESSPDAMVSSALNGTITGWNRGAEQTYGYTPREALGQDVTFLVPSDRRREFAAARQRVTAGESVTFTTQQLHRNGFPIDVSLTLSPIRNEAGANVGFSAVARDISEQLEDARALEQKRLELLRAQRDFEDLYNHAPDVYVSVDPASETIIQCNQTIEERLGYKRSELIGRPMLDLYHALCHAKVLHAFEEFKSTGRVTNARLLARHKDGRPVPVLLNASAARDETGAITYSRSSLRDISELVALEARKSAMLDAALDAVVTIDHQSSIVEFNPAAESMFGCVAADVEGKNLADVIIPPRLREEYRLGLAEHAATGESSLLGRRVELPAVRSDGTEFPAELSIVRLDGIDPAMFTGFIRDLTEITRARENLELTVENLKRSNDDLEQFAYIASHDLQEPLRMVNSYMQLFARKYRNAINEEADQYIEFAVDGAQRMKTLVDDLLTYSRVRNRAKPLTDCDLAEVLGTVLDDLSLAIGEAEASVTHDPLPRVWADVSQMKQVLQNLISNAIKFRSETPPRVHVGARRTGECWRFVVEDNGIGFEAEHADRIFLMFQRLHERSRYSGSGIGLAITKRIIERHGGRIWAESTPGAGSRFFFELPDERREDQLTSV